MEGRMRLAYWDNPKGLDRIYVNQAGIDNDTKVWLQESASSDRGWSVRTSGSNLTPFADKEDLESAIDAHLVDRGLGLPGSVTWKMLTEAARSAPKRAASKPAPGARTNGKTASGGAQRSVTGAITADVTDLLDLATIKLPNPVKIQCDHREPEELLNMLRVVPGVELSIEALPIGDFVLCDRVVVERKAISATLNDLEASIINDDKRLFYQTERMKLLELERFCVVLIEGDVYGQAARMTAQAVAGALSYLAVIQGMSLIPTLSMRHTAYMLLKMATHCQDGLGYDLALRGKKPVALLDQACFVLEGLPAVSQNRARRLLERFGSIRGVMNASVNELMEVHGIGKDTAGRIHEMIHSTWSP